jgi:SprT-like protein
MLNEKQFVAYSNKFLKDNYGLKLEVPFKINGRLRSTHGKFAYAISRSTGVRTAKSVQLSKFLIENNSIETVLDILRHELVHYALFVLGKPNKDGHEYFEKELKRLGIISQSDIDNHLKRVVSKPRRYNVYECGNCNIQFKRQRALSNGGRYHTCGKCRGSIVYKGKIEVEVS